MSLCLAPATGLVVPSLSRPSREAGLWCKLACSMVSAAMPSVCRLSGRHASSHDHPAPAADTAVISTLAMLCSVLPEPLGACQYPGHTSGPTEVPPVQELGKHIDE